MNMITYKTPRGLAFASAVVAAALSVGNAFATDVIHTASAIVAPINWTAATWTPAVADWTTTAGDLVQFAGNATVTNTFTLDTNVTVGSIKLSGATGNWTILGNGVNTLTLDGTGISGANQTFGNAGVASLVNSNGSASLGSNRLLVIGSSTTGVAVNFVTNLDIGVNTGAGQSVNTYGTLNNTSASAKTLTFRANSTAGTLPATNAGVNINSSIGTSGSAISIVNSGTGSGTIKLIGAIGGNVTSITQNSATSILNITGSTTAFTGNTIVTAGKLTLGSAYTFASGTSNSLSLTGSAAPVAGTSYGQIAISAGALTFGGSLNLNFTGTAADGVVVYDLFNTSGTGALAGSFTGVTVSGSYVSSLTNTAGVWSGVADGVSFSFSQATGDLTVTASAVPEPSTYAIFAGLGVLCIAAIRRRRSR